jgi:hypothetical protein
VTSRFKHGTGNWTDYRRQFPGIKEVDFHFGSGRDSEVPYWERMAAVRHTAHAALVEAQAAGCEWVMFTHGASTSRVAATTARSQIRGLMRSAAATPYIVRSECIQHETVFIARIKARTEVKV